MDAISPDDLADRIERGEPVTLLDTRNRSEIDEWRIDGPTVERIEVPYMKFAAAKVSGDPLDLLPDEVRASAAGTSDSADGVAEPVVAVCARGEASDEVAAQLREAGIDAVNLADGMHGWARVYRRVELAAPTGAATVYQYQRPSSGCLAYLVVAREGALVVDPLRAFADRYHADAADLGVPLVGAVDTHVHADHVSGLRDAADGASAYMSERAIERGVEFPVQPLADGDTLTLGDVSIEVVATPGHTTGMVSLRVGDLLLCGDTLFVDGVPRPDLQRAPRSGADGATGEQRDLGAGGDDDAPAYARDLHRTLTDRLARFDDETVVAPGHYGDAAQRAPDGSYTASLGALRERLWAFDVDAEEFVERVLERVSPQPANFEEIISINLGRETADDEAAFELELGPNNCAAAAD